MFDFLFNKQVGPLDCRVEEKDSIKILGYKISTTTDNGQGVKDIRKFWRDFFRKGLHKKVLKVNNTDLDGILGVNVYNTDKVNREKFEYYIGCASNDSESGDMDCYIIPKYTWAIFSCSRRNVSKITERIVTEWQPTSGYKFINTGYETGKIDGKAPDVELYHKDRSVEIWIAVEKIS